MDHAPAERCSLRPRLGVVVTTWSHESGADYAKRLVELFPQSAPSDEVEIISCPSRLENEKQIPAIVDFFADKCLDALCLVPGNFTLDHVMPLMAQAVNLPSVLWALPTQEAWGALVAVQQTTMPFKELGLRYRLVVGELGDRRGWDRVLPFARAAALLQRVKGLRIGLMGWRAQGMSDVTFDELCLRETFGVQVINVGLTRYDRALAAVAEHEVEAGWRAVQDIFDTTDLPDSVGKHGVRSYLAMRKLSVDESLRAVTVECFHDHLGGPCLGCSMLNDQGLAAACESDVPSALLMAAGQILSGEPTFHADFIKVNAAENTAILHHCGNLPRELAAEPQRLRLIAIPEHIGPGASGPVIQATMRAGPVTLVNLVGRRGTLRMCAMQGEVIPYELEFPGSAAKVAFDLDLREALEKLGNAGYGHHFVLICGHVGHELAEWCGLLGINYLQV